MQPAYPSQIARVTNGTAIPLPNLCHGLILGKLSGANSRLRLWSFGLTVLASRRFLDTKDKASQQLRIADKTQVEMSWMTGNGDRHTARGMVTQSPVHLPETQLCVLLSDSVLLYDQAT